MSNYFNNSDIEKVREAINIVDVVRDFVTLKQKRTGDWWGLCPFHHEKTSSFHVRSDQGMFHCFGCGKGGNAFGFLMEIEGVSFNEAVRMLAERAGIQLSEKQRSGKEEKEKNYRDQLYLINNLSESWFHNNLVRKDKSQEANKAYKYLIERGITDEIIKRYRLGLAGTGWDDLLQGVMKRSGCKAGVIADAGLALRRKDGSGYIDRFRGRIMFPIHNLSGKPIAFGGRVLDGVTPGDEPAKYVNTSETAIYHKGKNLYGLFNARDKIRRSGQAYLVEGYTDLLALIQADILNATASLGTALTQDQARLLKRFTPRVVIVYDSDLAGINAAKRAADTLTVAGLEVRIVMLPEGEDPDTMLRSGGSDLLQETLNNDLSFVQFHLQTSLPEGSEQTVGQAEKLNAARELLETIKNINDPIQRDMLLNEISENVGVRTEALYRSLERLRPGGYGQDDAVSMVKLRVPPENNAERDLISALLGHPELVEKYMTDIAGEHFKYPAFREIYLTLEGAFLRSEKIDIQSLPDNFTDPAVRAFIAEAVLFGEDVDMSTAEMEINGCINALRERDLREQSRKIEQQINRARKEGNPTRELMKELIEVQRQMRELGEG
ncbi:DNA primase [bacterium]|nr:DNA primase [bacterium]